MSNSVDVLKSDFASAGKEPTDLGHYSSRNLDQQGSDFTPAATRNSARNIHFSTARGILTIRPDGTTILIDAGAFCFFAAGDLTDCSTPRAQPPSPRSRQKSG